MGIMKTLDGHANIDGRITVGSHCSHGTITVKHEDDSVCLSATSDNGTIIKMQVLLSDIEEAVKVTPDGF